MFKVTCQTLSATSVFFFFPATRHTDTAVSNLPLGAARSFFTFFFLSLSLSLPILFNNILDDAPVRSAGRFAYIPAAKQPIDSTLEDGQTIDPSLSLPLSRSLWLANRSKPLYGLKNKMEENRKRWNKKDPGKIGWMGKELPLQRVLMTSRFFTFVPRLGREREREREREKRAGERKNQN